MNQLLNTTILACQGADLIIESPSVMGGIHVAQAMQVPYYRSMPFPWSKTSEFPQPFFNPGKNFLNLNRNGFFNSMTHVIIDRLFWRISKRQINEWRSAHLNLPKISNLGNIDRFGIPYLYSYSQAVASFLLI